MVVKFPYSEAYSSTLGTQGFPTPGSHSQGFKRYIDRYISRVLYKLKTHIKRTSLASGIETLHFLRRRLALRLSSIRLTTYWAFFVFIGMKGARCRMSIRKSGIIKWYHKEKHFGFILSDEDNREVFFHINDCHKFTPTENMPIEFEMGLDRTKREKAMNIRTVTVGTVGVLNGTNNN